MAYINKAYTGLSIILAASLWGCATQSVSSPAKPAATGKENIPAKPEPLPTAEVINIRNQTMNHHRTMFAVSQGTSTYYIGGSLTAVIDESNGTLVITPEGATGETACEYSPEGILKLENTSGEKRDTAIDDCDALLRTLKDSLEAP